MQGMNSSPTLREGSQPRKLDQQRRNPLEFIQEPMGQLCAALLSIEARGLQQVQFCAAMEAVGHAKLALMRANAAAPGWSIAGSESACASRSAATAFHFASLTLSESKLLIN